MHPARVGKTVASDTTQDWNRKKHSTLVKNFYERFVKYLTETLISVSRRRRYTGVIGVNGRTQNSSIKRPAEQICVVRTRKGGRKLVNEKRFEEEDRSIRVTGKYHRLGAATLVQDRRRKMGAVGRGGDIEIPASS